MNAPTDTIDSVELDKQLNSASPPRVVDVRTPAEFETAHIAGSFNVPLDLLRKHQGEVARHLPQDVVLVCKSGQRASQANDVLRNAGVHSGRVLDNGFTDWERREFEVEHGEQRWELERQVRLVAGSAVLTSVLGSIAVPPLKWVAAAIGGGLTFAALTNTCAMATALAKLPYNRGATSNLDAIVGQLSETTG